MNRRGSDQSTYSSNDESQVQNLMETESPPDAHLEESPAMTTESGFIGSPNTKTDVGSNGIICVMVSPQNQKPIMPPNDQPASMANSQSLLLVNSNLSQPFNDDRVMGRMAFALSGSSPRNNNENVRASSMNMNVPLRRWLSMANSDSLQSFNNQAKSVAVESVLCQKCVPSSISNSDSLQPFNNHVKSVAVEPVLCQECVPSSITNPDSLQPFSNQVETVAIESVLCQECVPISITNPDSLQPFNNQVEPVADGSVLCQECVPSSITNPDSLQPFNKQFESVAIKPVLREKLPHSPTDVTTLSRQVTANTWLSLDSDIGIGDDHYVAEHC